MVAHPLVRELVDHGALGGHAGVDGAGLGLQRVADLVGIVDDRADRLERVGTIDGPEVVEVVGGVVEHGEPGIADQVDVDGLDVEQAIRQRRRTEVEASDRGGRQVAGGGVT